MGAKISRCLRSKQEEYEQLTSLIVSKQSSPGGEGQRTLLVFINPHSGKGRSLETFAHLVAPKLDSNLIRYEVVVTTGPNHARDVLIAKENLGMFNGILILSGDGLVFEALNGILSRVDAFNILSNLPIGIIPSGSGNGLLCSVLAKHGVDLSEKSVMNKSIEIATSPTVNAERVALYSVKTETERYAAFLSVGWGLMADIDIESEKWRKLGKHRFDIMGFIRSCNLRSYRGRLTYRPYKARGYNPEADVFNVYDKTTQERIDEESLQRPTPKTWTLHDSEDVTSSDPQEEEEEVIIEDNFINMYAVTLSHIGANHRFAPSAQLEDNRIHLSFILWRDIRTRVDVAKYLLAIEQGKHLDLPFVKNVEVSSMKLEVLSEGSYVVLDGEVIETKSIEVSSTRNNFRVFSST